MKSFEYWKWTDNRTLRFARQEGDWQSYRNAPGNLDIHRVQRGAWGELGYKPADNNQDTFSSSALLHAVKVACTMPCWSKAPSPLPQVR